MQDQRGPQNDNTNERAEDAANNEVGPTEKLQQHGETEELSVPGAQNPDSKEIKDEQSPNTE